MTALDLPANGLPLCRATRLLRMLVAGVALLGTAAATAQPVPPAQLPSPAEPGVSPIDRGVLPTPVGPQPVPPLTIRVQPDQEPSPDAEGFDIEVASIVVEGATAYDPEDLARYYQDLIGKTVPLSQLFEAARQIEARYRRDGYALSRAVVPEQSVSDGRYRIQVIEGYVSEVTLEGDVGNIRPLLERYLSQITEKRPVNVRDLERYLLLVNDVPGVTARGSLRPASGTTGGSQLVVTASVKTFAGFATVLDRGSRYTGPWSGAVAASASSLTPFGDKTEVILYRTLFQNEQSFGQVSVEGRVGSEGLRLRAYAGYSPAKPGFSLKELNVESWTKTWGVHAYYPVMRSRRMNLAFDLGLDYQDAITDVLETPFNDDRTRMVRLQGLFDLRDSWDGFTSLQITGHKGLQILKASSKNSALLSRASADPTGWKVTGELTRLQALYNGPEGILSALVSVTGQYTSRALLATEEFRLGGERFGRGFVPAEMTGDQGAAGTAELQFNIQTGYDYFSRVQAYAFFDYGTVWNLDFGHGPREFLASTGAGFRYDVTSWLAGELEMAKPIWFKSNTDPDRSKAWRPYTRVTARF